MNAPVLSCRGLSFKVGEPELLHRAHLHLHPVVPQGGGAPNGSGE